MLVPLTAVAHLSPDIGPLTVNHSGQLPSVTLSFNLAPGRIVGRRGRAVQQARQRDSAVERVTTAFSGTAQAFQQRTAGLLALLVLAIFVIYVVLGVLYESFIHPLTILSGLPFAAFGALLTLLIFHIDLSVYAFVGIILLDRPREEERDHDDRLRARGRAEGRQVGARCDRGGRVGAVPADHDDDDGGADGHAADRARRRAPAPSRVARSASRWCGGLAFSQLITLYVTPVVYTYLDSLQRRLAAFEPEPEGAPLPATGD